MNKRIITWTSGNNPTHDEFVYSRGFVFGNYGHSAAEYDKLIEIAQKDFPHLTRTDIKISKVTESSYMKHFKVISFSLPPNTNHPEYENWDKFDFYY